jgi:AraC family transcriptional regulator, transcriptional activator of pobA
MYNRKFDLLALWNILLKLTIMTTIQKCLSRKEKLPAIRVETLEEMDRDCPFSSVTPQKLSHFEFIWFKKGTGSVAIDMEESTFSKDTFFYFSPGQCRKLQANSPVEGYYIALSMDFYFMLKGHASYPLFLDRLSGGWNATLRAPEIDRLSELNDILRLMVKEHDRNTFSVSDVLIGLINLFLLYLLREIAVDASRYKRMPETDKVMQFMTLVKRNFVAKRKVSDYANDMAISPNYLNSIVKKISGFSASYHIQQCIILEAKRQVIFENMRLKEVAHYLGFVDSSHFSRYFKSKCGMNFTSFRNCYIRSRNIFRVK